MAHNETDTMVDPADRPDRGMRLDDYRRGLNVMVATMLEARQEARRQGVDSPDDETQVAMQLDARGMREFTRKDLEALLTWALIRLANHAEAS